MQKCSLMMLSRMRTKFDEISSLSSRQLLAGSCSRKDCIRLSLAIETQSLFFSRILPLTTHGCLSARAQLKADIAAHTVAFYMSIKSEAQDTCSIATAGMATSNQDSSELFLQR